MLINDCNYVNDILQYSDEDSFEMQHINWTHVYQINPVLVNLNG